MSIIFDPLKKVRKLHKKEKFLKDSALIRELEEDYISKKRKERILNFRAKLMVFIGSFVIIVLFLVAMGYLFYSQRNKNKTENIHKFYDPKAEESIKASKPKSISEKYDLPGDFGIKVDGVMWDDQNPKVMFNDKILSVGESFGEMVIVNITKDHVEIKLHGKIYKFRY